MFLPLQENWKLSLNLGFSKQPPFDLITASHIWRNFKLQQEITRPSYCNSQICSVLICCLLLSFSLVCPIVQEDWGGPVVLAQLWWTGLPLKNVIYSCARWDFQEVSEDHQLCHQQNCLRPWHCLFHALQWKSHKQNSCTHPLCSAS